MRFLSNSLLPCAPSNMPNKSLSCIPLHPLWKRQRAPSPHTQDLCPSSCKLTLHTSLIGPGMAAFLAKHCNKRKIVSQFAPFYLVFRCLCCGRFFFVLCCCRIVSLFCAVTASAAAALLLLLLLCCCWLILVAVAARAAAVGAAGGFCVFLSGCFTFRVDVSFFLHIFSVIQVIAE